MQIDRSYSLEEIRAHFDQIEEIVLENKEALDIDALMTNFSQRRAGITAYLVSADDGKLTSMEAVEN